MPVRYGSCGTNDCVTTRLTTRLGKGADRTLRCCKKATLSTQRTRQSRSSSNGCLRCDHFGLFLQAWRGAIKSAPKPLDICCGVPFICAGRLKNAPLELLRCSPAVVATSNGRDGQTLVDQHESADDGHTVATAGGPTRAREAEEESRSRDRYVARVSVHLSIA